MNQTLNELVNGALIAWVEMTGIDLESGKYCIRLDGKLDTWDIKRATDALNESRNLDETGLTTWMMLRSLVEEYMKSASFNAYEMIFEPGRIKDRIASMRKLYDYLNDPLVVDLIDDFESKIRAAATSHGLKDIEGLNELLKSKYSLAYLRRDAFLSMDKLRVHQFLQGEGDKLPIGLNPNVYEIWNLNSLVQALRSQHIPGITTILVRDPQAYHSFFVFAIKNGDNITILTDKDEEIHPAWKRQCRRMDRKLEARASRHWFPYELLDIVPETEEHYSHIKERNQLVPINVNAVKLQGINELNSHQFVWLLLLSELFREKFWTQNYHTPQLSYTGDMVIEPHALVGEHSSLVKAGLYTPLIVEPVTAADITTEAVAGQWEAKPTLFHSWMEDRYAGQVPVAIYNVLGDAEQALLIEETHEIRKAKDDWGMLRKSETILQHFDPQEFGTKDKIVKDRIWIARYNQMQAIEELAKKEFEETKKDLLAWYKDAIRARENFFIDAAAKGELIGQKCVYASWQSTLKIETSNLMQRQIDGPTYGAGFYSLNGDVSLTDFQTGSIYDCPITGARASIFTIFTPNNPEALATFLGVPVDELPWQLKNWYWRDCEPYSGNSILNRLDPIDWVLSNPWSNLSFRVGVPLSKRAYKARRKELGLPPFEVPKASTV